MSVALLQIEIGRRNAWKDAINYQGSKSKKLFDIRRFVDRQCNGNVLEGNYKWQFRYSIIFTSNVSFVSS